MKKILLLVLFISGLFVAGCSKGGNGEAFIGTWKSLDGEHSYVFYRDGDNISLGQQKGIPLTTGAYDSSSDTLKLLGDNGKPFELKIEENGTLLIGQTMKYCNDWLTSTGTAGLPLANKKKLQSDCINMHTFKKVSDQ